MIEVNNITCSIFSYPMYTFVYNQKGVATAGDKHEPSRFSDEASTAFFTDVFLLKSCDLNVVTFSSNVSLHLSYIDARKRCLWNKLIEVMVVSMVIVYSALIRPLNIPDIESVRSPNKA